MLDFETIKKNHEQIVNTLSALTDRPVEIMAVTKNQPVEAINYAINELGISYIGENRVQELLSKYDQLHKPKSGKLISSALSSRIR